MLPVRCHCLLRRMNMLTQQTRHSITDWALGGSAAAARPGTTAGGCRCLGRAHRRRQRCRAGSGAASSGVSSENDSVLTTPVLLHTTPFSTTLTHQPNPNCMSSWQSGIIGGEQRKSDSTPPLSRGTALRSRLRSRRQIFCACALQRAMTWPQRRLSSSRCVPVLFQH